MLKNADFYESLGRRIPASAAATLKTRGAPEGEIDEIKEGLDKHLAAVIRSYSETATSLRGLLSMFEHLLDAASRAGQQRADQGQPGRFKIN